MRRRSKFALSPWLMLVNLLPRASAHLSDDSAAPSINLSQFQPIYGFSPACTAAYDTPITGCTASDFTGANPCSTNCINGLEQITALLDSACQNTEADPTTLIGLFFAGKGVAELCPNAAGSTTAQPSDTGAGGSSPSSTAMVSSTTSTSNAPSPTNTPSSSALFALGSSSTSSATPKPISTSAATMSSSAASSAATSHSSSTTITTSSSSSVPHPTTTASNPDQFGGGGSPFEVSSGTESRNIISWMLYGVALCVFMACFI